MRVLIYSPYSLKFCGGGERWIIEVASRLCLLKHKVTIVTTRFAEDINPSADLILANDIILTELPFLKLPFLGLLLPLPVHFQKLHNTLKSVDAVYFNNVFPFQELMILAAKLIYKKPVINMYQAPIYITSSRRKLYQLMVSRHIVRFFDAHHVLNEADSRILIKWKAKNIHYIPNGVATDKFLLSEISPREKFKVLFAGRLNYHKGFDILLKLIEIINHNKELSGNVNSVRKNKFSNRVNLEFSIIGNGFLKSRAQDLEKRYQNIKYLGQIRHDALSRFYSSASLLIMPSRWEGMPLVALEAQSSGLPIVASDIPGLRQMALNNESITLVKTEDTDAFVKAIDKYYALWRNQREDFERLRRVAREKTQARYDWNKIVPLIAELLNGR